MDPRDKPEEDRGETFDQAGTSGHGCALVDEGWGAGLPSAAYGVDLESGFRPPRQRLLQIRRRHLPWAAPPRGFSPPEDDGGRRSLDVRHPGPVAALSQQIETPSSASP